MEVPNTPTRHLWLWIGLAIAAVLVLGGFVVAAVALNRAGSATSGATGAAKDASGVVTVPLTGSAVETSAPPQAAQAPTVTAPPPAQKPAAPPPPTPELTEKAAFEVANAYLTDARTGQASKAKALVTPRYLARIQPGFFSSAQKGLQRFEVWNTERQGPAWVIVMKETWDTGTRTTFYTVVMSGTKALINDAGVR